MDILIVVCVTRLYGAILIEFDSTRNSGLESMVKLNKIAFFICSCGVLCADPITFEISCKWPHVLESAVANTCINLDFLV